jgi:signal transduction histidine kinase
MSLRRKIIILFGLLAVAPLLALAAFSYWHAQNLMREMIQEQLQQSALAVARDLRLARVEIDSSLVTLARELAERAMAPGGGAAHVSAVPLDSLLALAAYVGLTGDAGPVRLLAGSVPVDLVRCDEGEASRLVTFSRDLSVAPGTGISGALEAAFWLADLVGHRGRSQGHSVAVLDPSHGSILYGQGCHADAAARVLGSDGMVALAGVMEVSGNLGTFRFKDDGGGRVGSYARVPDTTWNVVATASMGDALVSLRSLAVLYWIFVLGLGLFTALAFSILIGHYTRSLSELARAAEEIGLGELDPWLPLHTSGELGQLTAAFSGMLARIRRMMAQVDESGRLAVVGQLSAYLAHEIRNPLSSIKLNLQRLRRWTRSGDLPEYCLEPLEISLREVERLNDSVNGVLQLSSAEDLPREVVSLHHLVEEASCLLASKFRRQGVGLSLDLDARADRILARPGQLKSAVLNLMVNALEAQPHGGRLEIRTELARAPELGGPVVNLHFRDEGPGVAAEIRDRIFEPFFTTKPGGSGIGLAMASRAIRASGGELRLEPSFLVGRGSDFVMVFPLAALEATEGKPGSAAWAVRDEVSPLGSHTIPGGEALRAAPGSPSGRSDGRGLDEPGLPSQPFTPEGLSTVPALSRSDSEEVP